MQWHFQSPRAVFVRQITKGDGYFLMQLNPYHAGSHQLAANLSDYANSPKTTIGDATFKLAGTVNPNTGRLVDLTLTIVPANIDEQIQAITSEE